MIKLYLDCDGVILDTIDPAYEQIKKSGKELNEESVMNYYQNLNWYNFILEVGDIKNALEKIKLLLLSECFDIKILTHVHSDVEKEAKIKYFSEVLPNVPVITVPKSIAKADYVDATGAILVDDFTPNLDYWYEKGGIPIKFSSRNNRSKYTKITDLEDLINIKEKINNS